MSSPEGVGLSISPLPKPLSSFIGRRSEIDELTRILGGARLLTLTGPGGCGKTRLALWRLSITERTLEAHLEQVRNQLGLHNRAQVAT